MSGGVDWDSGGNTNPFHINYSDTSPSGTSTLTAWQTGTSTDPYDLFHQTASDTSLGGVGGIDGTTSYGSWTAGTSFTGATANSSDEQPWVHANVSGADYGPFQTISTADDDSDNEGSTTGSDQVGNRSTNQVAGSDGVETQQVVVTGQRTSTTNGTASDSSSIYPNQYQPVTGVQGVMPVGNESDFRLARDIAPLPPEYSPRLSDGRPGVGIAFRDLAGQVFFKTFDANGNFVQVISAPVALAVPSATAIANAAVAEAILNVEMALGPPQLKMAAQATLLASTGLAAQWWMMQNADNVFSRNSLSPDELRLFQDPMANPVPAGTTNTTSYPSGTDGRIVSGTPGNEAIGPVYSGTTTTPITEASWATTVVDKSNEENNRDRADQRYNANQSLIDPRALAGREVSGLGTWGYPNEPRGKTGDGSPAGANYQEQRTGVPYGLELNVAGTWFDGYRMDDGRAVLIDTKDWDKFVFPDKDFWINTVLSEAQRQVNAVATLGGGVTIEWQVSTQEAATQIQKTLDKEDDLAGKINVVYMPKKGP